MNFKSSGSFDDLHPRTAPAPESFTAVSVSCTVPEVSLVFSPSSVSVKQLVKKASSQSLEDNAQNSVSKHINVKEKRLQDSTFKILQHERPEEKCRLSAMKCVSYNSHLPSSNIQLEDHMHDKLRGNQEVDIRKTMPSSRSSGPNDTSNIMTCLYESHEAKSYQPLTNHRTHTTQPMSPPAFQSNSKCTTNFRGRLLENPDLKSHGDMMHISQIPAHHCLENGTYMRQALERRHNEGIQNMPAGFSCDCCLCGKHQYCINQSSCILARDIIANNRSTSMAHVPNHIPHLNASNCVPHAAYIETHEKFCNKNVHGHSRKCVNSCVDVSSKSNEYNAHLYDNNERFERKIHSEEETIPLNRTPVMKQYEHSANKYKENLETNVNNSKDVTVNKTGGASHASSSAEIHRQESEPKKNCVSPLRASPEGKINDRRNSDASILQEIALMNQKQCGILQGLLQQIVVMQADQMKILSEINEKLSNARVSEDSVSKKPENNCSASSVFPTVENVTTQTSVNERSCFCCQNCDGTNEKVPSSTVQSLQYKETPINPSYKMNVDTKTPIPQNHDKQEKDQNKIKKLQDRAVSWSAVHGVEVEESFTLHGVCVPTVVDQLPSSVHTMHLHVQDYHSSASFDSITESKNVTDSNFGGSGQDNQKGSWTLYDNIVGHVKKFLQTVPCEKNGSTAQKTSQVEAIRFATIEKIRQLGVSVYENSAEIKDLNTAGRIHFDSNVVSRSSFKDPTSVAEKSSSDASLELQTLALKYLQDDDLCDVVKWNQNCKTPGILKTGQKSANISLATQHYLEKYHLLPPGTDCKDRRHINASCGQIHVEDNILDITTLKRQPKLL